MLKSDIKVERVRPKFKKMDEFLNTLSQQNRVAILNSYVFYYIDEDTYHPFLALFKAKQLFVVSSLRIIQK